MKHIISVYFYSFFFVLMQGFVYLSLPTHKTPKHIFPMLAWVRQVYLLAWVRQVYLLAWVRQVYFTTNFHFALS